MASSYRAIHGWLNKNFPRTRRCEFCACTNRRTVYAKADNRLTRDRTYWFELCDPCHYAYDKDKHTPPPDHTGVKRRPDSIAKSAAKRKGRKRTPEQIARIRLGRWGY